MNFFDLVSNSFHCLGIMDFWSEKKQNFRKLKKNYVVQIKKMFYVIMNH